MLARSKVQPSVHLSFGPSSSTLGRSSTCSKRNQWATPEQSSFAGLRVPIRPTKHPANGVIASDLVYSHSMFIIS
jgi:hypothetical protein